MHANFSAWLRLKSTILGPIFWVVFVKKINFLTDDIGFYYKKSLIQKEIQPFTGDRLYESELHRSC